MVLICPVLRQHYQQPRDTIQSECPHVPQYHTVITISAVEHRSAHRTRDAWRGEEPAHSPPRRIRHPTPHIPLITLSCPYTGTLTRGRVRNIRHSRFRNGNLSSIIVFVIPVLSCNFPSPGSAVRRTRPGVFTLSMYCVLPSKLHHTRSSRSLLQLFNCAPSQNSTGNGRWDTALFSKRRLITRHTFLCHERRSTSAAWLLLYEPGEIMIL